MMYKTPGIQRRKFLFFPLIAFAFVAAASGVVMLLWNNVLADVITVKSLSYLQAAGIFLLSKLLFGNFKGRGGPGRFGGPMGGWRNKIRNMSDEDKEKFRADWKDRCGR
ncbi:MAG: hypothetical protein ABI151_03745 [Chitinophagaceae bacterium]